MIPLITYEPLAGENIHTTARNSLILARKHEDSVISFDFNGVPILVTSWDTVESIRDRFDILEETFSTLYLESPAYKRQQEKQLKELKIQQSKLDDLLATLWLTNLSESQLIAWLVNLVEVADNSNLVWSKTAVAERLTGLGYKENAFIGLPEESYKDKNIMAGYIVGQAIEHLNMGLPPHPKLSEFAKQYKEIK